jgi:Pectate lyase superfamily protein/Right handed beta helix region
VKLARRHGRKRPWRRGGSLWLALFACAALLLAACFQRPDVQAARRHPHHPHHPRHPHHPHGPPTTTTTPPPTKTASPPTTTAPPPTEYNVQSYGAKGDGVTNDGPAIQAAIDAAAPSHGTVFFPEGTYQLVLPAAANRGAITARAGVTLRGPGAVLRANTVGRTGYGALVGVGDSATPAPGVTIRDLTFDGMANDNTIGYELTMGVALYAGAADAHVTEAHFRFLAGDGVNAGEISSAAGATRIKIDHNEAFKVSGQAFLTSGTAGDVEISDNSIHDNMQVGGTGQNATEAIWSNDPNTTIARNVVTSWGNVFTTGDDGRITDNTVTAAPGEGNLSTMMNVAGNRVVAENNVLDANGATPIKPLVVENPFTNSVDGITIRDNTIHRFSGANPGIFLFTPTTHLTVDANTVNGGTAEGERFADLFNPATAAQCTITNNHFDSTGTPAIAYYDNLIDCTISGNTRNGVPL